MNQTLFKEMGIKIQSRRPAWQFILEDNVIRILTHQFQVDWAIINEILDLDKTLILVEVTAHQAAGLVLTIKSIEGV